MIRRLALLGLAVALAGCGQHGLFRDRGHDYLRAETGKPLVYPDGITPIAARELYPVPEVEQRRRPVSGQQPEVEIPPPPQLVVVADERGEAEVTAAGARSGALPADRVELTADGNGYPVLMLGVPFDRAWRAVGDALPRLDGVKVDDLDRGRGVYFVQVDGQRNAAAQPWQLKLNYTANGIQVALQVDENAMAPRELAAVLMARLQDGLTR